MLETAIQSGKSGGQVQLELNQEKIISRTDNRLSS